MIVSVASGKGGAGKTTVAASLAWVWDRPLTVVDLDVEEPNLHLFLNPELGPSESAILEVPELDKEKCTGCGACAEFCHYGAVALLGARAHVFPEMCHGCGGCLALCPEGALTPGGRVLGEVLRGRAGRADFLMGRLRVGEAMSPPLMRAVKARLSGRDRRGDVLVDSPPGVSCPAVTAVSGSDAVLLVTEPTPFGLHDFRLAVEAFSPLGPPLAAVINRAVDLDATARDFCRERGVPVLAEIPYSRDIAEGYARGRVVAGLSPELTAAFAALRDGLRALVEARHA